MDGQAPGALERWRTQLDGWAIPDEILASAPESPWCGEKGRASSCGCREVNKNTHRGETTSHQTADNSSKAPALISD